MRKLAQDTYMSSTATATTFDYIDAFAEAGFLPADEIAAPSWVAQRYEAAIALDGHTSRYLVANYDEDSMIVQLLTPSGCIVDELRFAAPDCEVSGSTVKALVAVVTAWSSLR